MVTGRLDVSRVTGLHASRGSDGRVRDGNVAARGVAHGLWVRSGSSCRDEVGGLSGGSEHVVVRDFEDGEILQVDGEFQLPSERESSLEFASSDQASHGSVVDEEHGPEREDLVEPRNVYMSRWASDEDDVPRDTEEVSRGDRSRSMEPDCRDYSVFFSRADEDFESKLDSQVAMADDESNMSMGSPHISIDMCQGCRSVFEYERLNEIGEGTYGKVYRARDKKTGEIVALKKVKINANLDEDGFPLTALREINILSALYHPNIVNIKEVVIGDLDSVFMGMECMDLDLKGVMQVREKPFSTSNVKWLMLQLLEGVKYLHDNWVLHRDFVSLPVDL